MRQYKMSMRHPSLECAVENYPEATDLESYLKLGSPNLSGAFPGASQDPPGSVLQPPRSSKTALRRYQDDLQTDRDELNSAST